MLSYHPSAYKELESFLPDEKVIEQRLKAKANLYHYRVLGSFNPGQLNFNDNLFIDAIHCNRIGINEIFKKKFKD